MSEHIAMMTGSFDPVTLGHVNIIGRAARLFDKVYAVILSNGEKAVSGEMFTPDERLKILESSLMPLKSSGITNVEAALWQSLTVDFAKERGVTYIIRGLRTAVDFDYECQIAAIMKEFDKRLETVFLPADQKYSHLSSTYARELVKYGCDLSPVADDATAALMREIYSHH